MAHHVAIIMRSKNEMPHIQSALKALQKQHFRDYNLFAIDSGSTDGSVDLLREYCDADHFSQLPAREYAPGKVLNDAISACSHPIIVLLNADAIPCSEDWLEKLIAPLLEQQADATYSRQIARPDARFIVSYDYLRAYDPEKTSPDFFSAVACAFKRDLWENHKFQDQNYAEDQLWADNCRTFGGTFQFVPESMVEHSHNYTLTQLYYKKYRHGIALAKTEGKVSALKKRFYLCFREIVRDIIFTCRQKQICTLPYNIAYRITTHAGLHRGIKEGTE